MFEKQRVWLRERQERSAEKKAARVAHPTRYFHSDAFLITLTFFAVVTAGVVEWAWAVLFTINTTGLLVFNTSWALGDPLQMVAAFDARWPVLLGRALAMVVIVVWSMIWLPMWFKARGGGRWLRVTMAVFGLVCNGLVIWQGTFVLNETRQDQIRSEMVVEQTADQGRAAIGARIAVAEQELARITDAANTSNEARAARAGVAGWRTYIREAQADPGVPAADRQRIVRAMGSAEAADAIRRRIEDLTVQRATTAPEAATVASVEDTEGAVINSIGRKAEVYWPLVAAMGTTGIGIFGAWWLVYVWSMARPYEVPSGRSGWAGEDLQVEDQRANEAIVPQPMKPAEQKQRVYNAETGAEEVFVQPRGYWRKSGRKQKNADGTEGEVAEFMPDPLPDETGVMEDGGARMASSPAGPIDVEALVGDAVATAQASDDAEPQAVEGAIDPLANGEHADNREAEQDQELHSEPSTDIDWEALVAETPIDAPHVEQDDAHSDAEEQQTEHDEPSAHDETAERDEPETDPARMIPAE